MTPYLESYHPSVQNGSWESVILMSLEEAWEGQARWLKVEVLADKSENLSWKTHVAER